MRRNLFTMGLLVLLAGCSLAREQAFNLGYKDRRVIDNLKKQTLYSIDAEGVYNQQTHDLIVFDGDLLLMTYTSVVNGVEQVPFEYSIEVIEDISSTEGVFRLYGSGPLSGQYIGMQILTNFNGAYVKLNTQGVQAGAIEGARAMAQWNWVTDPLVFRSFKSFPVGTPVVYLSDPLVSASTPDGVDATTTQQRLRFIKLANPSGTHHTNLVVEVDGKGTTSISDDTYRMTFNSVFPNEDDRAALFVSYDINTVKLIPPNTEVYGVTVSAVGAGGGNSPIGGLPTVGATGFIAVEFLSDAERGKVAARMAFEGSEFAALSSMRSKPLFRWESLSTADLPTRVLERFKGDPVVQVSPYVSDEISAADGSIDNLPLAYNWENTREFLFNTTNFTVRVLDVRNRSTNSVNYRFRMVDDVSTNEGVIQLLGTVGALAGQFFHLRHYYPVAGELNHGYDPAAAVDTFKPSEGPPDPRPQNDTRLLVKIGQGATEAVAKAQVETADHLAASNIIYQSKTNAYKPQRLFVNMHKRGSSWAGVQDDGTYSPESATNLLLNSVARTLQVRITTNAAARFSTYRFFVVENLSETRLVAILSNIPNTTVSSDFHNGFLEPAMNVPFANADNDLVSKPFHNKYVALILGSGVDSTRAKIEFADTKDEALRKVDNRVSWNLYESTAIPTPNRVIKTLAGITPLVRLDANGFYNATHTEQLKFDADDMAVTITWHRSDSAVSLDRNIVAAARYTIPLPLLADTSLQEGVFRMVGGDVANIRVPNPDAVGTFYPTPAGTTFPASGGVPVEGAANEYRYANNSDSDTADTALVYSVLVGTLADANKVRAGRGVNRAAADAARAALTSANWHTLADAPLSPDVIIQLMTTSENNGNLPFVSGRSSFPAVDSTSAAGFEYQPFNTFEYEFAITPNLQMTVRQLNNTQTTSRTFPLLIVNNLSSSDTIARINGTGSLGNAAAGRFVRIRIPTDADATATPPKNVSNATIAFYGNRADAEAGVNAVSSGSSIGVVADGDFSRVFNIRQKSLAALPLNKLPNNKTYQILMLPKTGVEKNLDTYQIFNPRVLETVYISFRDIDKGTDARIDIKPLNALDPATYSYEVMLDHTDQAALRTLYVKLIGEGQIYHNRFAAFRFNAEVTANPDKMQAIIGETIFTTLQSSMIALTATEATAGWHYADVTKLYDKDIKTFQSAAEAFNGSPDVSLDRIGSYVRVDKNGVFDSRETDIFSFNFEGATKTSTNMILDITSRTAGSDVFGRYHFIPLQNTPANGGPNFGSSDPSTGTPPIARGQIMYGYLISFNFGVDGSTASAPFNNHFAIIRTDTVDEKDTPATGIVRSLIIATNSRDLGLPTDPAKERDSTSAFQQYNFWFENGVTPRAGASVPILAFNFRDRVNTDVNSRVIDLMAANPWVELTNFPGTTFNDAPGNVKAPAIGYVLNPVNHRQITIKNFDKTMEVKTLSRSLTSGTVSTSLARYSINVREVISDYAAIVQLSANPNTEFPNASPPLDQRWVYLEVPSGENAVQTEQRTRNARIIIGAAGQSEVELKAARAALDAQGEWNAANMDFALNQLDTTTGISEKAFRQLHARIPLATGREQFSYYYSYSSASSLNPTNDTVLAQLQWDDKNWLAFRPIIRRAGGDGALGIDTPITNFELARRKAGADDYNYTNVINVMQADTPRTVFQLAGTLPNTQITPENFSFSNLFMAVEYGTGINDRTAKVVFADTRANVLSRLNAKTTYNYFQGGMATNSGSNEEVVQQTVVNGRGIEWVTVSNTIHNPTGIGVNSGLPGLAGQYAAEMDFNDNIFDGDDYSKVSYDSTSTTNFILNPTNKTIQEIRVTTDPATSVTTTNAFIYGYTVIESSFIPSLSPINSAGLPTAPNPRVDRNRYQLVLRLEGFGDYKNLFLAGEIGRFRATETDPGLTNGGSTVYPAFPEAETFKARLMFGIDVASAKAALLFMQTNRTWNFVTRVRLTKPSPILDADATAGALTGLNIKTKDPVFTTPIPNSSFYARLATATGAESNVIDPGNHTNFSFLKNDQDIPFVTITSVRSNVDAQVRYRLEVSENFFDASAPVSRRSNDVIITLDNAGSPLHGRFVGIRRNTARGTIAGDVFSMVIGGTLITNEDGTTQSVPNTREGILQIMGVVNTTDSDTLSKMLPITLRYSNDMARDTGSANPAAGTKGDLFIPMLVNNAAGIFAALDDERVFLPNSNSVWTYDDTSKLMTIRYSAPSVGGVQQKYFDPISKTEKDNNSAESYRVIPVMTTIPVTGSDSSKGAGVVLLRSDDSQAGSVPGFLHNKYLSILYHGSRASGTIITGAEFVFTTNASTLRDVTNLTSGSSTAARYTVLAPHNALNLAPLERFVAIANPDDSTSFPSTWALSSTDPGTTNNYQYDPSNTLLFKMTQENLDERVIFVENVFTPVDAAGYAGATVRHTVRYRVDLIHSVPLTGAASIQNSSRQIGLKLIGGRYITSAAQTPSGLPSTDPGGDIPDMFLAIRTARLTASATPELDSSWQPISAESLYLGYAPQGAQASAGGTAAYASFTGGGGPNDPYGVAAYTGSLINNAAVAYYFRVLAEDSLNFMTTPQNTIATNKYSTGVPSAATAPQLFFRFNVGTGNGNSHGWGGVNAGVPSMNVGFSSELIVKDIAENNIAPIDATRTRMANYWVRPIRIVDQDTFIFQLYNGQALPAVAGGGFNGYTSGGITYSLNQLNTYVSNKYWIIRAGSGSELWRARITNGNTAAEALQNLGSLTSPNLAPESGLNRRVLANIANGIEYVGNADVDITIPIVNNPADASVSAANKELIFKNRVPERLELDNYTNWVFSTDTGNPSVTVTIRSTSAGIVSERQATYGISPVYSSNTTSPYRGVFALSGFGPFGGRLIAARLRFEGSPVALNSTQLRLVVSPANLARAVTTVGSTTTINPNWNFLRTTVSDDPIGSPASNPDRNEKLTYKASRDTAGNITWGAATYFNFQRKIDLTADAGILSKIDSANNRIVSKTNTFFLNNNALQPRRVYDPDQTTIYSANFSTIPPTIIVQEPGESPVNFALGGASAVQTGTQDITADNGAKVSMEYIAGAVRLGDTTDYLGIKILTTNVPSGGTKVEGNAGVMVIKERDATSAALNNTLIKVRDNATDVPTHSYIKNVPTTSRILTALQGLDAIAELTPFRTFDDNNHREFRFDANSRSVQVISLVNGGIASANTYTAVIVQDFAGNALNDNATSLERTGVILLKGTGPDANKYVAIKQKGTDNAVPGFVLADDAFLSKKDPIRMSFGNTTNAVLTTNDDSVFKGNNWDAFRWTYHRKSYLTGGGRDSSQASPQGTSINLNPIKHLSELYDGKWSRVRDNTTGNLTAPNQVNQFSFDPNNTVEYEFEYQRKLVIRKVTTAGATTYNLYAIWLTNNNPVAQNNLSYSSSLAERESFDDRDLLYMYHIGALPAGNTTIASLPKDNAALKALLPDSLHKAESNQWMSFRFAKRTAGGEKTADP
ncbi:MAG: hypothetical protein ACRCY4_06065, partial [Brevinema sp.]